MSNLPFAISIESTSGEVKQHPFHAGTDLPVARTIAKELFDNRAEVLTVAILRGSRMIDCLDSFGWRSASH